MAVHLDGVKSKYLLERTLDFIASIEGAPASTVVVDRFTLFLSELGLTSTCAMKIPQAGESLEEGILMLNHDEEWSKHYIDSGYVFLDPMVQEMFRTAAPFTWADVMNRKKSSSVQNKVMNEAGEFGLKTGFVVPVFNSNGSTGVVNVVGERAEFPDEVRRALHMASLYAHQKLLAFHRNDSKQSIKLTPREKECLRWVAAGKSDWDIGELLKISQHTVNFHIENAKRKLDVATRVQAAVSASLRGLLELY